LRFSGLGGESTYLVDSLAVLDVLEDELFVIHDQGFEIEIQLEGLIIRSESIDNVTAVHNRLDEVVVGKVDDFGMRHTSSWMAGAFIKQRATVSTKPNQGWKSKQKLTWGRSKQMSSEEVDDNLITGP
jgi:hypothetical protein